MNCPKVAKSWFKLQLGSSLNILICIHVGNMQQILKCSGLIALDTFVRENEHTNRGAYDNKASKKNLY